MNKYQVINVIQEDKTKPDTIVVWFKEESRYLTADEVQIMINRVVERKSNEIKDQQRSSE